VTRNGGCPCHAVRYTVDGPVRDVIVCHCNACQKAAGGPWGASSARREHFTLEDPEALIWEKAAVSDHDASRAWCRECGFYLLWDAPARDTVSFAADSLDDPSDLVVAMHIWVPDGMDVPPAQPVEWHD
jgi:hypothetical protein